MEDIKRILSENIRTLMEYHQIPSNRALAEKTRMSRASVDRMISMLHSPSLDSVQDVASAFGLEAWQLITPKLIPNCPPVYLTAEQAAYFERLKAVTLSQPGVKVVEEDGHAVAKLPLTHD